MNKPNFIEKIIQRHNEKELNMPKYKIEDLLVATINKPTAKGYLVIRDFAICVEEKSSNIFSPNLQPLNTNGLPQYYPLTNIHYLEVVIPNYMQQNNLNPNSKLSLNQILEIEKELNKEQECSIRFN